MTAQANKTRSRAGLLIFLCWLLYSMSYLGKVNYSASITQIIEFYGVTKAQAGMVSTFFFFAYGSGQVINGLFCSRYNIKWTIFGSMAVSALTNLAVALTADFSIVKWLWLVNGLALSVLWPTLVRALAEALPRNALSKSTAAMGTTVGTGTLVIYGLSAVFIHFDQFKLSFYLAALTAGLMALVWVLCYERAAGAARAEREQDEPLPTGAEPMGAPERLGHREQRMIHMTVGFLCLFCVGVNLIKDGLTTWVPSILKEAYGFADSLSILLTLFLPITAIFGNLFALWMYKRVPDYVTHCGIIFGAMGGIMCAILGGMRLDAVLLILGGMIVANYFAASLNNLVTSIYPMFMRGKVNSGLMAGLLNGFCYLGSTISAYGLGAVADGFGWTAVFWVLLGACAICVLAWLVYTLIRRIL